MEDNKSYRTNNVSKKNTELNAVDLFMFLVYHWKWFVLSLLICVGLACLKYARTPHTYFSSVKVLYRESSNNGGSEMRAMVGLDRYSSSINSVNVANEKQMLLSKDLLREMVLRTHADIRYMTQNGLRHEDHYGESPVEVCFLDSASTLSASLMIKLISKDRVELTDLGNGISKRTLVPFNKIVISVPLKSGRIKY